MEKLGVVVNKHAIRTQTERGLTKGMPTSSLIASLDGKKLTLMWKSCVGERISVQ